jgi:hypothetical protein
MDDIAAVAILAPTDDQYKNGGRVNTEIAVTDQRICEGAVVTLTKGEGSTIENPKGMITVDFGTTGCKDSNDLIRTGKIMFTYSGKRWTPGSTIVTTVDNYAINGIKLEGTRTVTNAQNSSITAPRFNIKLVGGKATYTDNTVAERQSDINLEWIISLNHSNDLLVVDASSTASGKTKGGRTYSVAVLKDLKYKRFCGLATEGIKKYTISGSPEIQVDYGNGVCDKMVLVTVNGVSKTVRFN